ncbi:MAG: hypothetical protein ACOC16_00810 [Nanoarchaeota archaeon]
MNFNLSLHLEKKLIFYINSILILLMIILFLFNIEIKYFFYINVLLTLVLSFIFFQKSKRVSKYLILTNLFIFFYFLYPIIAEYLYNLLGNESYIFILFYNVLIAYLFLTFSGMHKTFLGDIKKTNLKVILLTILIGSVLGFFFFLVREPVPNTLLSSSFDVLIFYTLLLALSEQIIFSGFLYNIYKKLNNQHEAYFQVATIFVLFHLLRFENLIITYFRNFDVLYLYLITMYYILLFIFMITALYLYNFKYKHYRGNFVYPVLLHFVTDLILFLFLIYSVGYV